MGDEQTDTITDQREIREADTQSNTIIDLQPFSVHLYWNTLTHMKKQTKKHAEIHIHHNNKAQSIPDHIPKINLQHTV